MSPYHSCIYYPISNITFQRKSGDVTVKNYGTNFENLKFLQYS